MLISLVLKYWRYGLTVLLTLGLAYSLHSARVSWLKHSHDVELIEATTRANEACNAELENNQNIGAEYETQIHNINTRHADAVSRLLRHEANKCKAHTSGEPYEATAEGLSTQARAGIITSLATCDKQSEQLEGLQEWVK